MKTAITTNPRRNRRGFALMLTIVLIGLVATTLAAIGVTCFMQVVRTRAVAEEAQLRQLLLAGTDFALSDLKSSSAPAGSVHLPDALTQQGAAITLHTQAASSPDQQTVEINATLPKRHLSQRVQFARRDGDWQITAAQLAE